MGGREERRERRGEVMKVCVWVVGRHAWGGMSRAAAKASRSGLTGDAAPPGSISLTAPARTVVDETAILLHPPLPSACVSTVIERERQQNDRLTNGQARTFRRGWLSSGRCVRILRDLDTMLQSTDD